MPLILLILLYYNLLLSLYLVLLKHVGCFWDHTNHNLYVLSINCLEFFGKYAAEDDHGCIE